MQLPSVDHRGLALSYTISSLSNNNGTLSSLSSNNELTFTPNDNWNGDVSFTVVANNGQYNSRTATYNITVNAINDVPTLSDITLNLPVGQHTIDLIQYTSPYPDVENDPISWNTNPSFNGFNVSVSDGSTYDSTNPSVEAGWTDLGTWTYSDNHNINLGNKSFTLGGITYNELWTGTNRILFRSGAGDASETLSEFLADPMICWVWDDNDTRIWSGDDQSWVKAFYIITEDQLIIWANGQEWNGPIEGRKD